MSAATVTPIKNTPEQESVDALRRAIADFTQFAVDSKIYRVLPLVDRLNEQVNRIEKKLQPKAKRERKGKTAKKS